MKLLQCIRSINPADGGTIESVRQLSLALERLGHRVEVASLDAPDASFVADFPLPVHALGPGRGTYGYSPRFQPWLAAHADDYDAVLVNGVWQYHSFATYRALRHRNTPYFVFTHGMLDPWFKRQYPLKHVKKWLYWPWGEYPVLRNARAVLFTGRAEADKARHSFWMARWREEIVSLGITPPPGDPAAQRQVFFERFPILRGKRILLFMSRIHEKKGCDLLVEGFAGLAKQYPDLDLVMAGPDSQGLGEILTRRSEALGIATRIHWTGMLSGDLKWGAYRAADAFILPSHQENFGIVVAEALACGLPVLISDKIDIWQEIRATQAGLVENDDVAGVTALIRGWMDLDEAARSAMHDNARRCFKHHFEIVQAAQSLMRVLKEHGIQASAQRALKTGI